MFLQSHYSSTMGGKKPRKQRQLKFFLLVMTFGLINRVVATQKARKEARGEFMKPTAPFASHLLHSNNFLCR